jgi:hypothetical protein
VLSDYENPPATLYRAMATRIRDIGDEARFYEERGNPWLRNLLTQRGAREFLEFQREHPAIDYVTFEPRTGQDLADWLTRVLATVDIVLVDPAAPRDIVRWIGELTRPNLHTFLIDPGERHPSIVSAVPNVERFSGVCVRVVAESALVSDQRSSQLVIEYGPASPDIPENGRVEAHLQRTASALVARITEAFDRSVSNDPAEGPG